MDSNQFDIDIPDTIPTYITRRHQKAARRVVSRPGSGVRAPRLSSWMTALVCVALVAGSLTLMSLWPSTLTYVVVPTLLLAATVPFALVRLVHKAGLDQI